MLTREQLMNSLEKSKLLLNNEMIEYLNGLINLDYSIVRDDIIDIDAKEQLSKLDIYKYLVSYNIYNRTKKIVDNFDKEKLLLFLDYNEFDWCSTLVKNYPKSTIDIFEFYYGKNNMAEEYGCIRLFRYLSIEKIIAETINQIQVLSYEKNAFDKICSSNEKYERNARYENLKQYYEQLIEYQNSEIPYKLEYANKCVDEIATDYGLESSKCLMIRRNGLTIEQHIKKI